jgi:methionyl-tRNA synthetase
MPDTPKKFYLTTPIYYVNARPHIGHAYSTIAADVIARRHRLLGDDTFFLTGTDEHGQKVQRSAEKAGIPSQQFADEVSATFRDLWARMGITNDDYIRTTDERHKRGVQRLWRTLEDRGAIYLSTYTGQYSVGEEMFVEGPPGTIGPDGKPTETVTEENYFFKLSEYQQPLLDLIESNTLQIQPEAIRNEVLSFVRGGLKDLSISRTTFDWGIPVPGNPKHVVYVWLDALANYMTAIGFGSDDPADIAKFEKYWPADLHLVGKEITRFHCVYWPAFLMAAGLPLPKSVVANGWLLFEESKMSKSRGNVIRTETILDAFGPLCPPVTASTATCAPAEAVILSAAKDPEAIDVTTSARTFRPQDRAVLSAPTKAQQDLFASDVIRYFLLREIPFGQDGSFSFDALITRYNADLANGYGNLVSRTLKMIKNGSGDVPLHFSELLFGQLHLNDGTPLSLGSQQISELAMHSVRTCESIFPTDRDYILQIDLLVSNVDSYLSSNAPWKLGLDETSNAQRREILYTAAEAIRIITAILYPVIPYATASVWRQVGLGDIEEAARKGELKNLQWGGLKPGTKLGPLAPIFPRADKGLAQIMNDMEAANSSAVDPSKAAEPSPLTESFSDIAPKASASGAVVNQPQSGSGESVATAFGTPPAAPPTPEITIDDFVKIDLRVAQIVVAERIPKADKLLRLEVDLGSLGRRQILSGIAEWYTPEELIGRRIAVIANLAPRKMRGLESHGMLLAASGEDHASKPILASFSDEIALGSRIR